MGEEKMEWVRGVYNKVGVGEVCEGGIDGYYKEGVELVDKVKVEWCVKEEVKKFVCDLMERKL